MSEREAFEASVTKLGIVASFEKHADGNYKNMQIQYLSAIWSEALAQANVNEQSQTQQPTDLSKQLREYAADSGYSHNDYADTMLAAASEIERYYGGMMAWKKTAETKDRKLSQEIENRISERCAARLVASQSQQYHSEDSLNMVQSQAQQERTKLIPMPTEESPRQWFFDCDDLYIDVEHLNGEVSIFVKHRSDNVTGWKELIEKPPAPDGE